MMKPMGSEEEIKRINNLRVSRISMIEFDCNHFSLSETHSIATIAHAFQCNNNHIDACSWEYDKGDWKEFARIVYLTYADRLLTLVTYEQAKHLLVNDLLKRAYS